MTTLVFSALTILCFLYAVNLYLEGKMTDVIGGVIGMLITADIILAFFLNKWWYGLIAVLLMFVLIAFLRPFGNFIASKLLGKRIPYNVKTSNSSHYLRKTLNGNGDWNKAMELVHEIFKSVEAMNPSKDANSYWQIVNRKMLDFDSKITGKILKEISGRFEYRLMILPDHPTPIKNRTHTSDPVPVAICGNNIVRDEVEVFTEKSAKVGSLPVRKGSDLMKFMIEQ